MSDQTVQQHVHLEVSFKALALIGTFAIDKELRKAISYKNISYYPKQNMIISKRATATIWSI